MAILTTPRSATAWSPDIITLPVSEAVPDALITRAATVVTRQLEGDAPVARIPWVTDDGAEFVAEGSSIDEADPTLAETTVATGKIAQLLRISREQWHQLHTSKLLGDSIQRAVTKRANEAFIAQPAPSGDNITPPAGLLHTAGLINGGAITDNLDPLADAVALIESAGGAPTIILANPMAWGALRKLKTGTGAHTTLLGAGTEDQTKRLLGLEVATSAAVPPGELLVIDSTAVAAAVGSVEVANSEHVYFSSDSVALRCTWRIGWKVMHQNRIARLSVEALASE